MKIAGNINNFHVNRLKKEKQFSQRILHANLLTIFNDFRVKFQNSNNVPCVKKKKQVHCSIRLQTKTFLNTKIDILSIKNKKKSLKNII